jgi:spermidine synthase
MTAATIAPAAPPTARDRALPWMLLLFIGSGCAALIYEIVWFQMLSLIVGSSAISLGVLLGTFMGGMCLGSLLLARYVSRAAHPLRVYARLEAGIGVLGLLILFLLPHIGGLYTSIGGPGFRGLLVRGLFCALCLLPPTLLMGATLPAISRWVETSPRGVSWLGFFYGGNIAGAVFGCLLAGFYLLRVHDVAVATFVAVALNAAVAGLGFLLSRSAPYEPASDLAADERGVSAPGAWAVYVTIALSGATALSAEVLWTRLLSLLLGATVYTFSIILAVFLIGLGIGSSVGAGLARSIRAPRTALGWCQLLLMAGIAWAAYGLVQDVPFWPIDPEWASGPWVQFKVDFIRALWIVLPAACLWGASFPLALAAAAAPGRDPGRLVGNVYAANTVGGILGALVTSLFVISHLHTNGGQRLLIALAAVSAGLMLIPVFTGEGRMRVAPGSGAWAVVAGGLAIWLASTVAPVPALLVGYGRWAAVRQYNHGDFIYVGEGMNSSMAVSRLSNGVLNYHNAGKVQASSEPQDMRLQRMLGHLTTLLPASPKRVLVIGCGAGVTAGAVSISPLVEHETIAEIEPLVPQVVSRYFGEHNYNVVDNPKVHVQIDDARHFLLTTREKFDAITSDPFDPWVKGAATLYTAEFFKEAKKHLNPGGVVTVFVQLYESTPAAVKSEVATFFEAFPDGMIFGNTNNGAGYDVVLVGQRDAGPIDVDSVQARLDAPAFAEVAQSLREIGMYSAVDLLGTYAGRASELRAYLADAQVNRDRNLRLQYLAGMGLNLYEQDQIYRDMIRERRFPDDLFKGSPQLLDALRTAVANAP